MFPFPLHINPDGTALFPLHRSRVLIPVTGLPISGLAIILPVEMWYIKEGMFGVGIGEHIVV